MGEPILESIARIEADALRALGSAATLEQMQAIERDVLAKDGSLARILRDLKQLDEEGRRSVGRAGNLAKRAVLDAIAARKEALESASIAVALARDRIDPTQPARRRPAGHFHPVLAVMRELEDLFASMGFSVVDGPEIESDYFNFEALNIPPHHPARDAQDTFYTERGDVLRTHTSGMQVRAMRRFGAPLRIVAPGRVFRNETQDASHEHTFHQLEGLVVDEGISVAHLKGVLDELVAGILGERVESRLRPHHFPFVEPGLELDFRCRLCDGRGCATCKGGGWIELCGCGMVHPKVLQAGQIDPERFTGFAFGLGIERLTMMRHGIADIRWMMAGDLRFLEQF